MAQDTYDAIFGQAALNSGVPYLYLRALAIHESNLKADAVGSGKERGLLQIHPITLEAYNKANKKQVTADESAQPITNAMIAVWLIKRIVSSLKKNHPNSFDGNWSSPRDVAIITQAYNAGESEKSGVGKLIGAMEKQKIAPERITYETIAQANEAMKINKWLSDKRRLEYVKRVTNDYMLFAYPQIVAKEAIKEPVKEQVKEEITRKIALPEPEVLPAKKSSPLGAFELLGLGALAGLTIYVIGKGKRGVKYA